MAYWNWHINGRVQLLQGLQAFYVNALLRSLVMALSQIFIPVFIYQTGVEISGSRDTGLLTVAAYYIVLRLTTLASSITLSKMIERMGFRRSMAASVVLMIGELGLLTLASQEAWLIWPAAIVTGIGSPLYWIARHSALSQDTPRPTIGKTIAWLSTMERISALVGPLAAGLIIERSGFPALFGLAIAIAGISVLPLWQLPRHTHRNGVSLKGFGYWLSDKRYTHQVIGNVGNIMYGYGIGIIWPLTMYVMGIKLATLGAIFSGVAVVTLGFKMAWGWLFDKLHRRRDWADEIIYGISALGTAAMWMIRLFVGTVTSIFVVDSIGEIFQTGYQNFQEDYVYLGGKRMGSIAFWVYREMVYSVAAIGLMVVMAIGIKFGVWKELTFLTISLWILASTVIAKESNLK